MSRPQIVDYFAVSRTARSVPNQKRLVDDVSLDLPAPKKAAYARFAHLANDETAKSAPSETNVDEFAKEVAISPLPAVRTKIKVRKAATTKTPLRERKLKDLSKQSTISWSPVSREAPLNASSNSKDSTIEPPSASVSVSPLSRESQIPTQKATAKQISDVSTPTRTLRNRRKILEIDNNQNSQVVIVEKPTVPLASPCKPIPAFERFAHLAEPLPPVPSDDQTQPVIPRSIAHVPEETELTQTEEKIPIGLPLPFDFRVLLELFRSCDTIVSMLHNRKEMCSFDKLKPAVQEVVRRNFEESHVAQFMTVYPMVYHLRYEKHLDKYTRRPTGAYVLVLTPNLRTDGTQIGHDSPSKGHLVFTGTRLIQRRNRFHRLLLGIVLRAHREFLRTLPGVNPSELPNDTELRRWHPKFALDSLVPSVKPSPLPVKPSDADQKITTARDAVRAFQARALFREAEACKNVAASRIQNSLPSIPSPTKASACSPRKLSLAATTTPMSPNFCSTTPSVALFSSLNSSPDIAVTSSPISANLKGISASLLARIRARENERRLLTQLTQSHIPESRRAIYARLPSFVPQVWTVMRTGKGRPLPLATVANRIAGGYHGGLSTDAVVEHLNVVLELCPFWLEKLNWVTPHLKVCSTKYSVKEILDNVKATLSKEGYQL